MAGKLFFDAITALLFISAVFSDDTVPIPADKFQLESWFNENVKPLSERKDTLEPVLVTAEACAKVVKVRLDGTGDYKTVTEAVNNIPSGNTNRVIVWIGGGEYLEKIELGRDKPFVTFYGSPNDMPTLVFNGRAAEYGTWESGTLIVEADYFSAVNLIIKNSARPPIRKDGDQAVAMRIGGDKASFYNCKFIGLQDTLCDDKHKHFFKDCYIEGTVDFIFGYGKSLYLNTEIHVGDSKVAMITAQARESLITDAGFSFVHCTITGTQKIAVLGRAWKPMGKVVFAYSDMSNVVNPLGWSDENHPEYDKDLFYGEYKNTGPGANLSQRVKFMKVLTDADVKPFITLAYIEASKWLLPPTTL